MDIQWWEYLPFVTFTNWELGVEREFARYYWRRGAVWGIPSGIVIDLVIRWILRRRRKER